MDPRTIERILKEEKIELLRLIITDSYGVPKAVEVPASRFKEAVDRGTVFDGSAIEGFIRKQEHDVRLVPDPDTFATLPWETQVATARVICDVTELSGDRFAGCPRGILRDVLDRFRVANLRVRIRPEIEFYLFERNGGAPTTDSPDAGGYFDLTPGDRGQQVRREVVRRLEHMNIVVDSMHHEVSAGQHEIDLAFQDPLICADQITTCRQLLRQAAWEQDLHGTFMPRPKHTGPGSGLHLFITVEDAKGEPLCKNGSPTRLGGAFVAGILEHARGLCALTNPLVNSYKRLVPDTEAPTHVFWSRKNKNPLVRIVDDHIEFRLADPSCNPYLAFAALLAAALEGVQKGRKVQESIDKDIELLSGRERGRLRAHELPVDLSEAIGWFSKDKLFREVLGDAVFKHYLSAKSAEWAAYIRQIHPWEIERYLATY